ncbi:murein L,D-transpeptidase catalytic domain-containing protein [Chitinophaga arvensicola]|uniref:L,D-transpeptidase catalytic domain n=1 Tax=Chitinophaga arvensicola TaxID=29529 RepID=A0A1I0S8N2_9BACT|nr:murein L,D-transpeptidase catalytic domain family protein [Chitinophaga arvensicola]SEW51113.1 L,D-transpeptidase catalytic domain [Chitinophaga arvensicola]
MRRFKVWSGWLLVIICLAACKEKSSPSHVTAPVTMVIKPVMAPDEALVHQKAQALALYAGRHGFNTHYAFLIDFNVFSGGKRFICYDLQQHKIISAGLVAHGQGPDFRAEKVVFSNVPGSRCSSLGKYRIGGKYSGQFGIAYKLYGLDSSNSKAFDRFVVLHSHACVPAAVQEQGICRSDGCPTLNPDYFAGLQHYMDESAKPMLLWIYK